MNKLILLIAACLFVMALASCGNVSPGTDMFIERVKNLAQATNAEEEEQALCELLTVARRSNVNYGYRVFSKTREKRVMPDELDSALDDELVVTIFVGEEAPYQEFEWHPKYNGYIARLIMP